MKKSIGKLLFGKSKNAVFAVLLLFALGCFCGNKGNPPPSEFVGVWEGKDGSTIVIRGDGSGDFQSGGTEITNGSVDYDANAKTLSFTFFGLGKTLKVDEPPNKGEMKLSGTVYRQRN